MMRANPPALSCVLELVVPTAADGSAQLRDLVRAGVEVPPGATVVLLCGAARYFNEFDVPQLAELLRDAGEVCVQAQDPKLIRALRAALTGAWRHLVVVQ